MACCLSVDLLTAEASVAVEVFELLGLGVAAACVSPCSCQCARAIVLTGSVDK